MLKRIINLAIPLTVIVGTLLIALNLTQINGATVISQNSITYGSFTWTYYKFDILQYLKNVEFSLTDTSIRGIIPDLPEQVTTLPQDIEGWIKYVINTLIYDINIFIYALNWLLLAPLKILLYPVNVIIALLGINTTNENFISVIRNIYNWQIDYIPKI